MLGGCDAEGIRLRLDRRSGHHRWLLAFQGRCSNSNRNGRSRQYPWRRAPRSGRIERRRVSLFPEFGQWLHRSLDHQSEHWRIDRDCWSGSTRIQRWVQRNRRLLSRSDSAFFGELQDHTCNSPFSAPCSRMWSVCRVVPSEGLTVWRVSNKNNLILKCWVTYPRYCTPCPLRRTRCAARPRAKPRCSPESPNRSHEPRP